ncbi:MAG: hypothetical protein ACTSO7_18030 [Candidatus Heimdallarchaeota archaeon]
MEKEAPETLANEIERTRINKIKKHQAINLFICIAVFFDLIFTMLIHYDVLPYYSWGDVPIIIAQIFLIVFSVFSIIGAIDNLRNDKINLPKHIRFLFMSIASFLIPALLFLLTYTVW